jgi:sugar phosphate isomerase/epimerase
LRNDRFGALYASWYVAQSSAMTDRREFLRLLGASAAAGALWPRAANALAAEPNDNAARLKKIGVQLYTVRDAMKNQGVDATLARIAQIGFREVEFAGYFDKSGAEIAAALRANGLASPSTHVSLEMLKDPNFARFVETAQTIGHKWVVLAWLNPPDRGSVEKYTAHAETLANAQRIVSQAGMTMAYHNHDFEFDPLGSTDGYTVLLERTKDSGVQFEMDLYWMTKAGKNPIDYWTQNPGRFPLVHVKDSAGGPAHEMRSVGTGSIAWADLFAQRRTAGIKHFYVEHDNPTDPWASLMSSFAYLNRLRFR